LKSKISAAEFIERLQTTRSLTTHSTGARDSVSFIIIPSGSVCAAFARARLIRALGFSVEAEAGMSGITFEDLIGKVILIGVTYADARDNIRCRKQWWGRVEKASAGEGICVNLGDWRF
jgi:hypothetical protein